MRAAKNRTGEILAHPLQLDELRKSNLRLLALLKNASLLVLFLLAPYGSRVALLRETG